MAYPTLAQAKVYMDISASGDDTTITQMLNYAIATVERQTGRVFVAGAATRTFPVIAPWVSRGGILLGWYEDLVSVTTLTNGDGVVIPATAYDLAPPAGAPYYQLWLRSQQQYRFISDGDGTPISLAGSWGYSAACPDDIFLALLEITDLTYSSRSEGAGTEVTVQGTIVDKSKWPGWVKDTVGRYARK